MNSAYGSRKWKKVNPKKGTKMAYLRTYAAYIGQVGFLTLTPRGKQISESHI